MVQVFITVDVEIWLGGWDRIEERFPKAFEQYVYGPTSQGQFGLPRKLNILNEYGVKADFFIEGLFASIFGINPLQEIVGLVLDAQQGVQLHLHPEWAIKVPHSSISLEEKHEADYSVEQYRGLFGAALGNLQDAGVSTVRAFRAGNYRITNNMMKVLSELAIKIDTSYNPCYLERCAEICPSHILLQPTSLNQIKEYPVSVFRDFFGQMRPMQISACSCSEMNDFFWKALDSGWKSVVIVSHNFELMDPYQTRPDWCNVKRFTWLCNFLDKHRKYFETNGFDRLRLSEFSASKPSMITSSFFSTMTRLVEQGMTRLWN